MNARWYTCHSRDNPTQILYARKINDDSVAILDLNTHTILTQDTPAVCRQSYNINSPADAITNSQAEAIYRHTLTKEASEATTAKIHNGYARKTPGYGSNQESLEVNQLQRTADKLDHTEFVLVAYDIHDRKAANPANVFWRYAIPLSESVWTFTTTSLQAQDVQDVLAAFKKAEVTVDVLVQSPAVNQAIREIAHRKLSEKLVQLHTSLIQRIANASDRLETAKNSETTKENEKLEAARDNQVRAIIKAAAESLEAAIASARLFDEEENVKDLLDGLRAAIQSEAQAFNAEMIKKGRKTVRIHDNLMTL